MNTNNLLQEGAQNYSTDGIPPFLATGSGYSMFLEVTTVDPTLHDASLDTPGSVNGLPFNLVDPNAPVVENYHNTITSDLPLVNQYFNRLQQPIPPDGRAIGGYHDTTIQPPPVNRNRRTSRQKPLGCLITGCTQRFSRSDALGNHLRSNHSIPIPKRRWAQRWIRKPENRHYYSEACKEQAEANSTSARV